MKKFLAAILALGMVLSMSACGNYNMVDTTYKFDRAIISLPDGKTITGKVDSWRDYEDGDQIQVTVDGVTYLLHSSNVALIKDKGGNG